MRLDLSRRWPHLAGCLWLALSGCGSSGDVTPSADVARTALERALNAWKSGGRPGPIEGTTPPVEAVDSAWRGGQRLAGFEVLREEPGEGDKRFSVRLSLKSPDAETEARYVVIGRGPVWVYREEDYLRGMNMDNNPPARKPSRSPRS